MNLRAALNASKSRKARITHDGVTTTVAQTPDGYITSFSGKQRTWTGFDTLTVFLTQEVVASDFWRPVQEGNNQ